MSNITSVSEESKLDEAIEWARDMAYAGFCNLSLVEEQRYENIANWLEELKDIKAGGVDTLNKYSRCKNCEYLHENGNCLKVGGFYSAVDDKDCIKKGSAEDEV